MSTIRGIYAVPAIYGCDLHALTNTNSNNIVRAFHKISCMLIYALLYLVSMADQTYKTTISKQTITSKRDALVKIECRSNIYD